MTYRIVPACRVHAAALLLALTGFLLAGVGSATAPLTDATAIATCAAAGAASVGVLALRGVPLLAWSVSPRPDLPGRIRTVMRDREHRTAFLPQRDPDAAGRPRPRAPGRGLPTAV
jgi:hypothetical protein